MNQSTNFLNMFQRFGKTYTPDLSGTPLQRKVSKLE